MLGYAGRLPDDLLAGFRQGQRFSDALGQDGPRPIVAVGLGGSAIAADLTASMLEAGAETSLRVVRGEELPRGVDARTTVIVLSHSGETREALAAFAAAGRRRARRIVIASGGRLAQRAAVGGVPVVRVPDGRPPRAALGHLWGALIGLVDERFDRPYAGRLRRLAAGLEPTVARLRSDGGPATSLARHLAAGRPTVVTPRALAPVGRRWASQLEENAKLLASLRELPEALHNAIEGWEALTPADARREPVVLLAWSGAPAAERRAAAYLAGRLRARAIPLRSVALRGEPLTAMAAGVLYADFTSLALARRFGVDPSRVGAIGRARAALAGGPR